MIEDFLASFPIEELEKGSLELMETYRTNNRKPLSLSAKLAYLAIRLPPITSALFKIFGWLKEKIFDLKIETFSDLGSGPGTAVSAILHHFPSLQSGILYEKEPQFIDLAKKFLKDPRLEWRQTYITPSLSIASSDLVVFSYSLSEMPSRKELLTSIWSQTKDLLLICEPGTQAGFSVIDEARSHLLALGAYPVAPCPHSGKCPSSWCHFYARVERTSLHRRLKAGSLSTEDEKFSYLIVSKNRIFPDGKRIVESPMKRSGHVHFTLCRREGIEKRIVSRKDKDIFPIAKKLDWGDSFPY